MTSASVVVALQVLSTNWASRPRKSMPKALAAAVHSAMLRHSLMEGRNATGVGRPAPSWLCPSTMAWVHGVDGSPLELTRASSDLAQCGGLASNLGDEGHYPRIPRARSLAPGPRSRRAPGPADGGPAGAGRLPNLSPSWTGAQGPHTGRLRISTHSGDNAILSRIQGTGDLETMAP